MAGMLDFLYGGPSTELNPPLDPSQFPMDVGYGNAPKWPTATLQRMREAQRNPLGTQAGLLSGLIPEQPAAQPVPTIAGAPATGTMGVPPLPPGAPVMAGPAGSPAPPMPAATGVPPPPPVGAAVPAAPAPAPAVAPQRANPITQLPQASAGVLDRINDYLRRNSNTLIGMGAGFAGAPSFGQGVSRAGYGALAGGKLDIADQNREATIRALMGQGYTRDQAEAVAGQSDLLKPQTLKVGPPGAEQELPVSMSPFGVRPLPINLGAQAGGSVQPGTQIAMPNGQVWRLGADGKWEKMVPGTTGT
jgi:hypothetical protein